MANEQITETIDGILKNVARLRDDADYLNDDGRPASAFVLMVIALEEIGKIVHERWKGLGLKVTPQRRTAHIQKQMAVACVLMTADSFQGIMAAVKDADQGVEKMVREFMESNGHLFVESVMFQRLDKAKQLGLYWDEDNATAGRSSEDITHVDVAYIRGLIDGVIDALPRDPHMMIAQVFYEVMPLFKDAIEQSQQ